MNIIDCNKIIEKLAIDVNRCCIGCENPNCKSHILIGDVLGKMDSKNLEGLALRSGLQELWLPCGFTKSLQEINEDGWDVIVKGKIADDAHREIQPHVKELFDFLNNLSDK